MNPDTSSSEDPKAPVDAPVLTAMREPPGRLGEIVRRLKRMERMPVPPVASRADTHGE